MCDGLTLPLYYTRLSRRASRRSKLGPKAVPTGWTTVNGCMCQVTSWIESRSFLNARVLPEKSRISCHPGSTPMNSARIATERICASSMTIIPPSRTLSAVKNQSTIGHGNACFPSSKTRSNPSTSQRGEVTIGGFLHEMDFAQGDRPAKRTR